MLEKRTHHALAQDLQRDRRFFVNNQKEALLVTGARQIGKLYVIREFGKKHFKNFVEINFLENLVFSCDADNGIQPFFR